MDNENLHYIGITQLQEEYGEDLMNFEKCTEVLDKLIAEKEALEKNVGHSTFAMVWLCVLPISFS